MPPVSATWALSQTTTDVVNISTGLLAAATSDNVNIVALLACEAYGATLAISPESLAKVHYLCSQSQKSAVVQFISAKIGWQKGDSGWQLAQNEAGLRFLGLAACLLTLERWTAAETLHALLIDSAEDMRLIPPPQQLKHLMNVLDYRLMKSGFSDNCVGWLTLLDKVTPNVPYQICTPSKESILKLVKATSNLGRVGHASKLHISVPIKQAAWVIAFEKWCLGMLPSITLENKQTKLTQLDSSVSIDITSRSTATQILLLDDIGKIDELIESIEGDGNGSGAAQGMLQLRSYGQLLLRRSGRTESDSYRACVEAIPYACKIAFRSLRFIHRSHLFSQRTHPYDALELWKRTPDPSTDLKVEVTTGNIFSDEDTVATAMAAFLNEVDEAVLKDLPDGTLLQDLPLLLSARESIRSSCSCQQCLGRDKTGKKGCDFTALMVTISHCVATILVISLFVPSTAEEIHLSQPYSVFGYIDGLTSAVYKCIMIQEGSRCSLSTVIESVLNLLGHKEVLGGRSSWTMSSYHGQTIYPEILEHMTISSKSPLRLLCVPGKLSFKGADYHLVVGPDPDGDFYPSGDESSSQESSDEDHDQSRTSYEPNLIQIPADKYNGSQTTWQVSIRDSTIRLSLSAPEIPEAPGQDAMRLIFNTINSLFINCPHSRMLENRRANPRLYAATPGQRFEVRNSPSPVGVFQTNRNEPMRFFALASTKSPCVIREDACLECCAKLCSITKVKYIIC